MQAQCAIVLDMRQAALSQAGPVAGRRKFLPYFKRGFYDGTDIAWERGYKARAHEQWNEVLDRARFKTLLAKNEFAEVAAHAVRMEAPNENSVPLVRRGRARDRRRPSPVPGASHRF
jgi:hypothetical protein